MVNARPGARRRLRSTGRPLPAYSRRLVSLQAVRSLCNAYGMHASRRQQQACVWNAASAGTCVRYHGNRCDLIEINSPEWPPLAACGNYLGIFCISADHRATGRPWATAVALASHTSRGSSSLRHRCAVCTAGLGNGPALRLVRLAARQLTAVAQPLQGPVSSARSCVPLRMRSITTGVSHLYRADPSSGHQAPMLVRDAGGCDDGSATRYTCSACPVLAGRL